MRTRILLLLLGAALFATSSPAQTFDPSGTWNLQWLDTAEGVAHHSNQSDPKVGGQTVTVSKYYSADFVSTYASLPPLGIQYNASANSVTLSGAGATETGTIQLDATHFGEATYNLASGTQDLGNGCTATTGETESVYFADSNTLTYRHLLFIDPDPSTCSAFLAGLPAALQNGSAPVDFRVVNDTGALDLSNVSNLTEIVVSLVYQGTKASG